MLTVILLAAAGPAVWIGSLYFKPFGACPNCHGKRLVIKPSKRKTTGKRKPKPPRPVTCPRCKGIGRRQRPGSKTVHRIARRVRRELDRQHKQRQATAASKES